MSDRGDMIRSLKLSIGYTDWPLNCGTCKYMEPDTSTDDFGKGDMCTRNPDISFGTADTARCDKWEKRETSNA